MTKAPPYVEPEWTHLLKRGDLLTHTRCMGEVEEHIFTEREGVWICGNPTLETLRIAHMPGSPADNWTNDISPRNVTHVDRVPVDQLVERERDGVTWRRETSRRKAARSRPVSPASGEPSH